MTPARFALTEAFGLFLHGADNDNFSRPTDSQEILSALIQKAIKKADFGKGRIKYKVEDGVKVIVELPEKKPATGKNTWIGRTSTNHRCAVAIDAGKLMAAALDQGELKAKWLEYVYDPYFDLDPGRQQRRFEQVIFPGVCGMWAFWPYKRKVPSARQFNRFLVLVEQCIKSYTRYARSGNANMKLSCSDKAAAMGYGSTVNGQPKGAYTASNWKAQWSQLDADIMRMLEELDEKAMAQVVIAFTRQVEARRAERGVFIA